MCPERLKGPLPDPAEPAQKQLDGAVTQPKQPITAQGAEQTGYHYVSDEVWQRKHPTHRGDQQHLVPSPDQPGGDEANLAQPRGDAPQQQLQ